MLRLLGRTFDGFERAVEAQASVPVAASWVELPSLEHAVLSSDALLDGSVDLALVVSDWLPALIEQGKVLDLAPRLAAAPPPDWPDGWSPSMRLLQTRGDRVYGVPYHDGPMMLLYRPDLFADAREQAGFAERVGYPLAPPASWEQFLDVARWFTRPGLYGTVLAGQPDGHNDVYDFLLQLWSRGGELSSLAGPAAVSGLEFLRRLRRERLVDPASMEWDSVASGEHFAAGEAALMVNWAGYAAMCAPGAVACAPVPNGVSLNIYWVWVVAAGSAAPGPAYEFLKHLASPEMDVITSLSGATGVRLSTWRDPRVRALSPYYEVIEEVHRGVLSPPPVTDWPSVAGVLSSAIHDVMRERVDPAAALAAASAEIDAVGWLR
ncbi:ABC transporter substrate-binding protein [Cryptosporangium phraense]|uniref:ABC transporter substrate-binding protein n=1 Tax=Cryptosporangium phraense TaxID=2593070 RepID=UPI00147818F1|nr:extracellular solute-binding protein [Cryptosporangium phraense]